MNHFVTLLYTISCIISFITCATLLAQSNLEVADTVDWQPTFNDKPVSKAARQGILEALPKQVIVQPQTKRKILIYSATNGYRHSSIPYGKFALEHLGLQTQAFESIISDDSSNFEFPTITEFDAIVLLNVSGDFFMP